MKITTPDDLGRRRSPTNLEALSVDVRCVSVASSMLSVSAWDLDRAARPTLSAQSYGPAAVGQALAVALGCTIVHTSALLHSRSPRSSVRTSTSTPRGIDKAWSLDMPQALNSVEKFSTTVAVGPLQV